MLEPAVGQSLGWDRDWEVATGKNEQEEHEKGRGGKRRAQAVLPPLTGLGWMLRASLPAL